jgi:hypothetical protein
MMGFDGVIPGVSETLAVASSVGLYLVYDGFGRWKTKRLIETPLQRGSIKVNTAHSQVMWHETNVRILIPESDEL